MMNILILGGTLFVGREMVVAALTQGHSVTIFHRGRLKTDPVEGVEQVIGDREKDLAKVSGRDWDVVIDTCCYIPRVMRSSLEALKQSTGLYVLISTINVYAMGGRGGLLVEDSGKVPLVEEKEGDENKQGENYGPNKLACELLLKAGMPERHLIVRPGLITGPFDFSYRVAYWVERFLYSGPAIGIDGPDFPVQWIDVRDLCEWVVRMAERSGVGVYNVVGPEKSLTSEEFYKRCQEITGRDVDLVYLPFEFLQTVQKLPVPLGAVGFYPTGYECYFRVSNELAMKEGLTFRDGRRTFEDTYRWSKEWGHDYYSKVTGCDSFYQPMSERLVLEKEIIESYERWRSCKSGLDASPIKD